MQFLLKDIAQIASGFSFRGALPVKEQGTVRVIQAKNINPEIVIDETFPLSRIDSNSIGGTLRLRKGDVLLATRSVGSGDFKATSCGQLEDDVIASSSVCIIRLNDQRVLPEYLAIFLNSPTGQEMLSRYASGAAVQSLLLRNIREIEINVPPLEVQRGLIDLLQNTRTQKQLLERQKVLLRFIDRHAMNTVIESNTL
jgi:restriction endonuclease S subunit